MVHKTLHRTLKKYSNTTLVKVKSKNSLSDSSRHINSNTTLVKVKLDLTLAIGLPLTNSNTTLVKVKYILTTVLEKAWEFKYNSC